MHKIKLLHILVREASACALKLINPIIAHLWERTSNTNSKVKEKPNAVVFLDGNKNPEGLKLKNANLSKVAFLATGSSALRSPNKMKICPEIIKLGARLHR